eukprot:1975801-Pyramimonas_sp.AAC.1
MGRPTVGAPPETAPDTSNVTGYVELSDVATGPAAVGPLLIFPQRFASKVHVYLRQYEPSDARNF